MAGGVALRVELHPVCRHRERLRSREFCVGNVPIVYFLHIITRQERLAASSEDLIKVFYSFSFKIYFFKNPHRRICLLMFRVGEVGRGGERERKKH